MNTPQELQRIFDRLPKEKVELEKVELGIADDLKQRNKDLLQAVKKADSSWKNYQDYLVGADKPFSKMIDAYNDLDGSIQPSDDIAKRYLKAGKELGVDLKSSKEYQNIESNIKTSKDVLNIINSFKDPSTFQK